MAKVVQTILQISESNVEQYCTADGLSLNTGGYAIRLYLNGHTQGSAILNNAAKEVLYPSATAHPFKIDSTIRANKSGGSMTISLQFNGTSVQSESGDWGSKLKNKTKNGISDSVVINSNRSTEIKWHIKGSSTVSRFSIASTNLTFYFNQYEMRPLVGNNVNGIQKVTVSNASPYQGDTVTFTPKLVNGATWDGWYSDAACTNLVSSDQNYSVTPSSDITLYAKATIDANLYNVSAVAGAEITDVSVSDNVVPEGGTATFTAQINTGCSFEAWYSDDTYTTVVSTENPYTATITANTTLYAKAHKNSLSMSVGSAEHGTASVSATTVPYGDNVTFTFTPEDETWELYGWYSDSGFTQLVSEANPYTFTATENVTLYPKVGKKRYKITLQDTKSFMYGTTQIKLAIAVIDFNSLTRTEINYLKSGEYDKIAQEKVYATEAKTGDSINSTVSVSILCPCDLYISIFVSPEGVSNDKFGYIESSTIENEIWWPYYWYQPVKDDTFEAGTSYISHSCNCSAIAKEGVSYADATTPTRQEKEAIFTAEVMPGYTFSGWYVDEACTRLTSADNPAYIKTPKYIGDTSAPTSVTLYAKATKAIYTIDVGTVEHGTASASATTAQYGDTVTFNCTVDEGYEFKGWYSDEGLTQLVSESNPYTHSVTGSVTLYPKVGAKRYTITLKRNQYVGSGRTHHLTIASLYEDQLTDTEREYIKTGEFSKIDQAKIFDITTVDGNDMISAITATLKAPKNLLCVLYSKISGPFSAGYLTGFALNKDPGLDTTVMQDKVTDPSVICPWNYYSFYPKASDTYYVVIGYTCDCFAIAKDGVAKTTVPTHVMQYTKAPFSAEPFPGYTFAGWYSDDTCTQLVSTDNPAQITCPAYTGDSVSSTSLTLYAKATKKASGTGIYIKRNGAFVEANAVHKKVNGAWVKQSNPASLFNGSPSGIESNYLYLGE